MHGTTPAAIRALAVITIATLAATWSADAQELTVAEKAAGWRLLFDGTSTDGWRGFQSEAFPSQGWEIDDGALHVIAGGGGGDIITAEQFEDFELALEWKVAPAANSGIMYRVTERHGATYMTGPEFQVIDDAGVNVAPDDWHSAGAIYEMYAPPSDKPGKPAGEWNAARIRVKDGVVQHFLNGRKVVEADMNAREWKEKIGASKFRDWEGFGVEPRGHIALQDHGNDVWYRDIRIRDLSEPLAGEQALFDGKTLAGWGWVSKEEGSDVADTWRADDGVLVCTGAPTGYLRTENDFTNYVLTLEWRFSPETKKAGNSGVLLRCGEDKVWPRCIEAQLESGAAGDLLALGGTPMETDPARRQGIHGYKAHVAERPPGEWNEYELIVNGDKVTVFVNGEKLNEATGCEEVAGPIGLQSEGVEIHFRNIRLVEIE